MLEGEFRNLCRTYHGGNSFNIALNIVNFFIHKEKSCSVTFVCVLAISAPSLVLCLTWSLHGGKT